MLMSQAHVTTNDYKDIPGMDYCLRYCTERTLPLSGYYTRENQPHLLPRQHRRTDPEGWEVDQLAQKV